MNAFENIVRQYLESEGYWVRQSVKVERLSREDKEEIGLPSMPRPEIDLVALNVRNSELLLVEVKSLLDSRGVDYESLSGKYKKLANRYRLFNNDKFRDIVTKRLREEYLEQGLINKNTTINYALATGKIYSPGDELKISDYFSQRGWRLFSPKEIKQSIRELSQKGWEDDPVTMTAKLILRDKE